MTFRRFRFEDDINESLAYLPLDVRRKLDLSGRRLSLAGWRALPLSARRELAEGDELDFGALVDRVAGGVGQPVERMAPVAAWRDPDAAARVAERARAKGAQVDARTWAGVWGGLDDAARYALWRLVDSKKDLDRLAPAMAELVGS